MAQENDNSQLEKAHEDTIREDTIQEQTSSNLVEDPAVQIHRSPLYDQQDDKPSAEPGSDHRPTTILGCDALLLY